jgi:O-succinylbenzoic acid--CoA ligase
MDISANSSNRSRTVISVDPTSPINDVMVLLAAGLAGRGPAVNFTQAEIESVPSDVAVIVNTTGTTGDPKFVALSTSALVSSARLSLNYLDARPGDLWSLLLPIHHIAGVNVLVRCLELGTTPVDLRGEKKYINVDFTAVVPTQIFSALNGDQNLLAHLQAAKKVLVGGAALDETLYQSAINAGISITRTYGMSETSGGCVYEGLPLGETQVRISNDGFIEITGPTLASGYLNSPDAWNAKIDHKWFKTSDLGHIDSAGVLTVIGRGDDLYISGGEKVSLSKVSQTLVERYSQNQWHVLAVDDLKWGQRLVIAVAAINPPSQEEITELLINEFGAAAKPKQYLVFAEFPVMGIGKINGVAIKNRAEEEFHGKAVE